jgi:catechol 2,3-dioxygenase-like lactoylglutathione lyase family enzyme
MNNRQTPLANVITLGARDVPALRTFYQRLGWPLVVDDDDFVAFELRGTVLALFSGEKLAADGREQVERCQGGIRFTIGIMVDRRDDVDHLAELVRQSGGRVTKDQSTPSSLTGGRRTLPIPRITIGRSHGRLRIMQSSRPHAGRQGSTYELPH